jgi:hypothetical protein
MKDTRYRIVAEQHNTIRTTSDSDAISDALARIAFAALPDWGTFEVPGWLIEGLRPLFARLMELSDSLKVDLLECLSHLYESSAGARPDYDLAELKANLSQLPETALPYALAIIASDGSGAETYLKSYLDHRHNDVRMEARAAWERLHTTTVVTLPSRN